MKKNDTSVSYDHYKQMQMSRASKKWSSTTFDYAILTQILNDTKDIIGGCKSIVCLGVRGGEGNELAVFKSYPAFKDARIVGVDICWRIIEVPGENYCYDFNEMPYEWSKNFDLVYSNSLDHAKTVELTLIEWCRILKTDGYLLLTLSTDENVGGADIYSFKEDDVPYLAGPLFETLKIWRRKGQNEFNVLLRKK